MPQDQIPFQGCKYLQGENRHKKTVVLQTWVWAADRYSKTNISQKPQALSSTLKPYLRLSAQAERIAYKHMSLWCVLINSENSNH